MSGRQKYNFERLQKYCSENNVTLLDDYSNVKLNCRTIIKSKCLNSNCVSMCEKLFKNFIVSNSYCSSCSIKNKMNKIKQYNIINKGYEFPFNSKEILNKSNETCIKKYNVSSPFKNKEILEKTKITLTKNYGVNIPILNENIKNKTKKTFIEKYGCENFLQTKEIKNIRQKKCQEKYGVNYYLQSNEVKEKMKLNNLLKYGVEYPNQNECIMEKSSKKSYTLKNYTFPSGLVVKIQGYENFALNDLINIDKINEKDIIIGAKNVPEIWYTVDNKSHRHYVDIYIPSQNKCIEVKSIWTFKKKKDNVLLKQIAAKELGYKYEIWIYDKKGSKICYN